MSNADPKPIEAPPDAVQQPPDPNKYLPAYTAWKAAVGALQGIVASGVSFLILLAYLPAEQQNNLIAKAVGVWPGFACLPAIFALLVALENVRKHGGKGADPLWRWPWDGLKPTGMT